jgi:hypothetical protein
MDPRVPPSIEGEAVVRLTMERKRSALGLGALSLICLFAFLGLRASDTVDSKELEAAVAPLANPPLNVREANVDADGYLRVHEQGVVSVQGTVNVGNNPSVQDVRITNTPLQVALPKQGTVRTFHQEFFPFDKEEDLEIDIHEFSRVRLQITVNGSDSTVDITYDTDGDTSGSFSVDTADSHTILLPEVAGTKLFVYLNDPDGEQVFVNVFGTY